MNLKTKTAALLTGILTFSTKVLAHNESGGDYYGPGMMMWGDGSWMHNTNHMMGYNMWGMGWFGAFFGLAFWILVILGIVYLYQQVTENKGEAQNE